MIARPDLQAVMRDRQRENDRKPLSNPSPTVRIGALVEIIDRWRNQFHQLRTDQGDLSAARDALLARAIETILELDDELEALTRKRLPPPLFDVEQEAIVVATATAIARAKGAALVKVDVLLNLAKSCAIDEHRQFVEGLSAPRFSGYLQRADIQERLEKAFVTTFYHEQDRQHRIIDQNWLTSHAAIRRHVLDTTKRGGQWCKFCRLGETDAGGALLVPQSATDRSGGMATTISGRRLDLTARAGYVHNKCKPAWERWLGIAALYETDAAAAEADRAARRVEVEVTRPPEPAVEPVPEPAPAPAPRDYYESPSSGEMGPRSLYSTALARRRARKGVSDGN